MPDPLSGILESTEPTILTSGWHRTEGPLWHPGGYVTFVDLQGCQLLRWDTNGQVTVEREDTGEGNGCTLDRQGRLLMCEGADHRRGDPNGGRWHGDHAGRPLAGQAVQQAQRCHLPVRWHHLFSPTQSCVCRRISGRWASPVCTASIPQDQLHLATDQCVYPNGLALSPDESVLYVAISREGTQCFIEEQKGEYCAHRRIEAFDVAADGTLSNQTLFCDMSSADPGVPDGMKVDSLGRVFCVGSGGFWIIDPSGEVLGWRGCPKLPATWLSAGRIFAPCTSLPATLWRC